MMRKTAELTGAALDWAVAVADGRDPAYDMESHGRKWWGWWTTKGGEYEHIPHYSTDWSRGGPIIEKFNITIIRADDDFEEDEGGFTTDKRVPVWFAECNRWTGHSVVTSYEGEHMEPAFMIGVWDGYYGTTPLTAAMRCFVASKLGAEVDIPDGL